MVQVSYKKLFELLIDNDLKETNFAAKEGIILNTLARMGGKDDLYLWNFRFVFVSI